MPRHSSSRSRSNRKKHSKKHRRYSTSSSDSSSSSSERQKHKRRGSVRHHRRSRSPRSLSSSHRKTGNSEIKKVFMNPSLSINAEQVKEYRGQQNIIIRSQHVNVPDPIMRFEDVQCFPRQLMDLLLKAGFKGPTAIQAQGWSIALTGHDLIGIAQTGSGKTLAFLLPAIVHILAQAKTYDPICLILAPTRELTLQIYEQFQKFSIGSQLHAACLYGGQDRYIQKNQLRRNPQILIACPGRLIDLLDQGCTTLKSISYLVLDEADRMLDMGFEPQIRKIVGQIRPERQTLLFSATWPKEVQKLALDFCHAEPVHIQIGSVELTSNKMIKQIVHVMKANEKSQRLLLLLKEIGHKKILIFCSTKKGCDILQKILDREGIRCMAIHGDKKQSERDYVMNHFRNGRSTALIATDVASRGLDIKDIDIVVNYDMPKVIEDYVHRIGRTGILYHELGRAGAVGQSISFFASDEDSRMAKDLVEILRESQNEIPYDLRALVDSHRHGNSYNPYRRWNTQGGQGQRQQSNNHHHPIAQQPPMALASAWSFQQQFNPSMFQPINPYQV